MIGFVIWTLTIFIFVSIGISTWKSTEAVGFFAGIKPPNIPQQNVKRYNHSVAMIWFVFSAVFEMLGIPLLVCEQNSPYFLITVLGTVFLVIGMILAYLKVESYFRNM